MKNLATTLWEQVTLTNFFKWSFFGTGTLVFLLGVSFVSFLFFMKPSQIADTEELYTIVVLTTAFLLLLGAFFMTLSRYVYWKSKAKELETSYQRSQQALFVLADHH